MPVVEELKRIVEKLTGIGRPARSKVERLAQLRRPEPYRFRDDGRTPNNPRLPLVLYRDAVRLDRGYDPAAVFEATFARHGWRDSWRDGVYDFLHFHSATHEVLGIARGRVTVRFGGAKGRALTLVAGDVAILPAGTGHRRIRASRDLLVVGAYPAGGRYDEPRPGESIMTRRGGVDRRGEEAAQGPALWRRRARGRALEGAEAPAGRPAFGQQPSRAVRKQAGRYCPQRKKTRSQNSLSPSVPSQTIGFIFATRVGLVH